MRKNFSKKIVGLALLAILTGYFLPLPVLALDYVPLVTLPGASEAGKPLTNTGEYIKGAFNLAIGIAAVLAIIMIIIGGIQYMGTESIGGKGAGLKKIKDAVLGLLLALGSYVLLFTINPSLVNFSVSIAGITPPTLSPEQERATQEASIATLATKLDSALAQRRAAAMGNADMLNAVAAEYLAKANSLEELGDQCGDSSSELDYLKCQELITYYRTEAGKMKTEAITITVNSETRTNYQTALTYFATLNATPTLEQIEIAAIDANTQKSAMDENYQDGITKLRELQGEQIDQVAIDKILTDWATRDTAISKNIADAWLLNTAFINQTEAATRTGAVKEMMDTIVEDATTKMGEINTSQATKDEIRRTADFAIFAIQANCQQQLKTFPITVKICTTDYKPNW
ncbi:MAG: hypothetical protein UW71_C0005G0026 [Parcubacteria group bacterium GW2011_GWB1_44_7]|nr:MAG: hypothetical protein UW71_C0005G0026 [Parcubacteria group bacterium GW2011_GWB1_44_7]